MGSVRRHEARSKKFGTVGNSMGIAKLEHVETQLALFRSNLEVFARKYKDNIKKDPSFRREFQIMCAKIGVDPLASTKGFWAELLGVGSFYTELGVQIVDACVSTRSMNGGLIEITALIATVQNMRGSNALDISGDDIERAVKQLTCLGSGFNVVQAGARRMVVSVPVELNRDHSLLLYAAQGTGGYITISQMAGGDNRWSEERTRRALHTLLQQGMCWEDNNGVGASIHYYFPSVWKQAGGGGSSGGSSSGGSSGSAGGAESKEELGAVSEEDTFVQLVDALIQEGLEYLEIRNRLESKLDKTLSVAQRRSIKSRLERKR